ncbi:MAG: hypothetical protein DMF86_24600 [Acidobacteria bacterium]|nr:MAG: hypothetical protein DMF86_24600 [Acidobacteriota bacterium]
MPARNVLLSVLIVACLAGCGSRQPLRVTGIQLGRSLSADHSIADPTNNFGPRDNIYLSVITTGIGSGTISVRWMYAGHVVDEPKKEVSYTDVAATDFRLQSAAGFPPGEYRADVFLDGQPAGTKTFRVEAR